MGGDGTFKHWVSPGCSYQAPPRSPDGNAMDDPADYLPPRPGSFTPKQQPFMDVRGRYPAAFQTERSRSRSRHRDGSMESRKSDTSAANAEQKEASRGLRRKYAALPVQQPQLTPDAVPKHHSSLPADESTSAFKSALETNPSQTDTAASEGAVAADEPSAEPASDVSTVPDVPSPSRAGRLQIPFYFPGPPTTEAPTPQLQPRGRAVHFRSGPDSELNSIRKPPGSIHSDSPPQAGTYSSSQSKLTDALSHRPLFQSAPPLAESSHGSVMPPVQPLPRVFPDPQSYYSQSTSQLQLPPAASIQESPYFAVDTHALESVNSSGTNVTLQASAAFNERTAGALDSAFSNGGAPPKRHRFGAPLRTVRSAEPVSDSLCVPKGLHEAVSGTGPVPDEPPEHKSGAGWSGYQPPSPPRPHSSCSQSDQAGPAATQQPVMQQRMQRDTASDPPSSSNTDRMKRLAGLVGPQARWPEPSAVLGPMDHVSILATGKRKLDQKSQLLAQASTIGPATPVIQEDVALIIELQCALTPTCACFVPAMHLSTSATLQIASRQLNCNITGRVSHSHRSAHCHACMCHRYVA